MNNKYSGYYAQIFKGDDTPSASAKGDYMKEMFPGSDYEIIEGDPCGICSDVAGADSKIADLIKDWINTSG